MNERRRSTRRRTYLGGQAAFEKPSVTDECVVRDLSPEGARIRFSGSTPIPDAFVLTIHGGGEARLARIVWRDGRQAGVAFQAAAAAAPQAARAIDQPAECDRGTP